MSQYLPMRFQTSAAGRSTVISIGIETYVGFVTTMLAAAGGAAGAGAWVLAVRPARSIANTTHAAAMTNLVLIWVTPCVLCNFRRAEPCDGLDQFAGTGSDKESASFPCR